MTKHEKDYTTAPLQSISRISRREMLNHGWNNFSSMLTGFKRDPQYLDTSDTYHRNYQDSAA